MVYLYIHLFIIGLALGLTNRPLLRGEFTVMLMRLILTAIFAPVIVGNAIGEIIISVLNRKYDTKENSGK